MRKPVNKNGRSQVEKVTTPKLKVSYIIILITYGLITVITPRFGTYDSNAPKFLALAFLNLFTYFFLITQYKSDPEIHSFFFRNKIGIAYALLMGITLISFSKAINIPESILSFLKYFTVFCAAYILSILLRSDKRYLRMLVIVITIVLISDCFTVFYSIILYISKQIDSIYEIKSVYSNKNMLAAAIFIKIPFALWLFSFEKGWFKKLGGFALFCAFLAIFFMSTRAFYLGLISVAVLYCTFLIIIHRRNNTRTSFMRIVSFFVLLVTAFLLYSFTQHYLFPKSDDIYNKSYTDRLATIAAGESGRLDSWKRSAILFEHDPLLGVGTGNWKIRVLKYENPVKSDYTFMVKNHNDFIEIATETGVFGGLLFLSLFAFVIFNFLKAFLKPGVLYDSFSYLFLPAFGMFCYSFDAFFNFPADRPEMQSLFALFIGAGIAYSPVSFSNSKTANSWMKRLFSLILILVLLAAAYVLKVNMSCLKLQRLYQSDGELGRFTHASRIFVEGFPTLLNVSSVGDPFAVIKSQYLMNEEKYQDVINILGPDKSSPYDGRREHMMAKAYSKLGNNDSALVYAYKAHELKPLLYEPLGFICFMLNANGKKEEAIKMLTNFIGHEKNSTQAWIDITSYYEESGNYLKAIQYIDSAAKYLPVDTLILQKQHKLSLFSGIAPYQQTYALAMRYFDQQKFTDAFKYLNEIVGKEKGITIIYARRAVCYFYAKEYQKCINDVNQSIIGGNNSPDLINIRGASYHALGLYDKACADFKDAAIRGDKNALANEQRLCNKGIVEVKR